MDEMLLNKEQTAAQAEETVNNILKQMPENLTPEQEKAFLVNSGRVLTTAALVIKEMLDAKATHKLN